MLSLKVFLLQLILDTRIGYLGSFLLYWKFSPDTYYVSGAWCVMSVGGLDGIDVDISYGRIISLGTTSYINAWYVRSFGDLGYDDYVVYGISYGRISPYLDNANLENCWCVTAEYEEFYGYVGIGDLRHNSYGMWCN